MKIVKHDATRAKQVLIGMIVSNKVLAAVASKWSKDGLMESEWENRVGKWCVDYYRNHSKAPKHRIEALFAGWASDHKNKDTVDLVEKFLGDLNNRYVTEGKKINSKFVIEEAAKLFLKNSLKRLQVKMLAGLEAGKISDVKTLIETYRQPAIGSESFVELFHDKAGTQEDFAEERQGIIKFTGPAGKFFGNEFERESFVAITAPQKRGKSYVLQWIALTAAGQRRRVAYFQCGDMSRRQQRFRFASAILKRPIAGGNKEIRVPSRFEIQDHWPTVTKWRLERYKESLVWQDVWKAFARYQKQEIRDSASYFRLVCKPTKSLSVAKINSTLIDWSYQGWVPDVIVIDYADILASPEGFNGDSRDAVNDNWMGLRRMAQELNCCVVTATQANAASYKALTLGMWNFSEDNRKNSHVTAMLSLNQSEEDKRKQVMSVGWIARRDGEFDSDRQLFMAGCLASGQVAVKTLIYDMSEYRAAKVQEDAE